MKNTTMKNTVFSLLLLLLGTATLAGAAEKKSAGPNGGLLITSITPHAEFLVTADRKVQITFVDDQLTVLAPTGQSLVATTGNRADPTRLTFARHGDVLLSDRELPAGNNFPTVLEIKTTPDAKPVIARFNLNTHVCGECGNAEYACICGH